MSEALSICIVVKNEEERLPRCLDSVHELAGELIVVDTGSADATPRIAQSRGAKIIPFNFAIVDFAAARNCAITHAGGRWILMLDADETLHPSGVALVAQLISGDRNVGYFLERHNFAAGRLNAFVDHVVRLFPNRSDFRYRGRVHEIIDASILAAGGRLRQSGIRLDHSFSSDPEQRRQKNLRYIEILKEEIAADPSDSSRLDFLAAEYHQLEMFEHATVVAEHITLVRPQDARAHLFAGVYRLLYQPDFPRARVHFNNALKLRPGYPEALSFLSSLEQWEKASL